MEVQRVSLLNNADRHKSSFVENQGPLPAATRYKFQHATTKRLIFSAEIQVRSRNLYSTLFKVVAGGPGEKVKKFFFYSGHDTTGKPPCTMMHIQSSLSSSVMPLLVALRVDRGSGPLTPP